MSEKVCSNCKSQGPFVTVPNGERCGQCGYVQPEQRAGLYSQPDVPAKPLTAKATAKNPLGAGDS